MPEKFMPINQSTKLICFDCKKEIEKNEDFMPYYDERGNCEIEVSGKRKTVFVKCRACHTENQNLNFQECEVFSRIVGYIRPVKNWNLGKAEEWKDRVEYKA